ncbi:hypothetical protein WAF17_21145 [Bernardetia sp. ABR2-2B]|uniref:hypothetical protein n=1 Tax=Bernardetia sp. ABR2-2B TaxID=3127472 RepID=UPI0030D3D5D8
MALILNGKSWQDKDSFLTPVTTGVLNGSFGEERILTLDYSFDQSLNDCEIYFNPALFVEQGIILEQSQTLPPDISYWYKVTASTTTGVEHTMNLLNSNASERNSSVTFELNADRLSFKIRLTCFLTADILTFLNDNGIDNSIRLLGNTKNAAELENLEDSVYNSNSKGIGIHTGIKVPELSRLCGTKGNRGKDGITENKYIAEGELFAVRFQAYGVVDKLEIFVNGNLTASSGVSAGNNFGAVDGFDGNAGAGYPLGSHPNPVVVPNPNFWFIGQNASPFDDRLADFIANTGISSATLGNYQQIIWVNCQAGDEIVVRVAGKSGTAWEYEIYCPQPTSIIPSRYEYSDAWINAEFVFLNEGTMTNPVFELSRNGDIETEFATFEDTDVTLRIDHSSAISNAKVWVIDADNTVQRLDFKKSYGYQPTNYFSVPVPVNVGGNTYETSFVIDKNRLNSGGRYFIIAVYYDSANEYVASYISDAILVTDVKFLTPSITGTIYSLVANFFTNYLEVSPLQRLCCEITLDKYTGFDAAYLGGNVKIGGETFNFIGKNNQGSFENSNRFVFSDSSGSLIIRFYLRVKEEWQNSEIDILWNINFNVEYTTIAFPQRISVTQMEQNKAIPNLTEIKLYKNGVELLEEGDTACDANFLRVETIKTAESVNYAQAAIWKDENGNVYEEEAWSPISVFTQASNAFQSDVEIQFDTVLPDNVVNHKITNEVTTGEVGMIGYPPPLPISFIRHPFQATTKTGRNVVFEAEYDYGAGKSFAAVNGFESDDFLFRVGTDTTPLNANDNAWAAFSDLTFAAFAALSITAGTRIMVRYIGTQPAETEQLNIAGYLEMRFSEVAVNPKTLNIPVELNISAGDMMLFTGLNMNFTFVTYIGGTATSSSAKRTFTEIADNEDLVTYSNGLGGANSPNNSFVPHLYFARTSTTAISVSLTVNQIEAPNVEVGFPALPLYNFAYPITGDGTNVQSCEPDGVNDLFEQENNDFKNLIDFASILNDKYINIDFIVKIKLVAGGQRIISFSSTDGANINARFMLVTTFNINASTQGFGFFLQTGVSALSGGVQSLRCIFETPLAENGIYKCSMSIKKIGNTTNALTTFSEPILCVNNLFYEGVISNSGTPSAPFPVLTGRLTDILEFGTSNNNQPTNFVPKSIRELGISISDNPINKESMASYFLDADQVDRNQHAFIYDNLQINVNPSYREINNIGTLGDTTNKLILKNFKNFTNNLL